MKRLLFSALMFGINLEYRASSPDFISLSQVFDNHTYTCLYIEISLLPNASVNTIKLK